MAIIQQVAARPTLPGELRWYPEAASSSWKKGQFVYVSNAGQLTVCADGITAGTGIAGIAEADASGTTNLAAPITIAKQGQQFTMNVWSATPSLAVTAVTMVGLKYGIKVTGNKCYLNMDDTSNTRVVVHSIAPDNDTGDRYGKVIVEVLDAYCGLTGGTS
jgi:hypothetical protein